MCGNHTLGFDYLNIFQMCFRLKHFVGMLSPIHAKNYGWRGDERENHRGEGPRKGRENTIEATHHSCSILGLGNFVIGAPLASRTCIEIGRGSGTGKGEGKKVVVE